MARTRRKLSVAVLAALVFLAVPELVLRLVGFHPAPLPPLLI